MKAITLWQPWATDMRRGLKLVETRSWPTDHRGPLAIHAGKQIDQVALAYSGEITYPTGAVLGVVNLIECVYMTEAIIAAQTMRERLEGDWRPGRFAWITLPLIWFGDPIPSRGYQKVWDWTPPQWVLDRLTALPVTEVR